MIQKLSLSKLIIIIVILFVANQDISYKYYKDPSRIIASDVINYYAYLPAFIIFHDMELHFLTGDTHGILRYFWPHPVHNGKAIIYGNMGMAIMYSPFFIAVHYPLKWLGFEAWGFSLPYRVALIVGCLFYLAVSLLMLRKILKRYFSETVTSITLLLLVLATNLIYYVADEPAMTHAYNFALDIAFLYLTIKWYEKPGIKFSLLLGLVAGLIALIRPPDVIVAVVFIFWGICTWNDILSRLILFLKKTHLIFIIMAVAVLVWVPQMLYWKQMTGHYLYNAYADDKSKFFFFNPQIISSLFGYRKGWMIYTPVMLLIFPGFVILWKKYRPLFWPVFIYFILNLWIVSSWYLPWYGGSYGQRAYIASYSIISLSLAAFFAFMLSHRLFINKILGGFLVVLFVYHNLFQLKQFHNGAIHFASMTKEAYWDSFGRSHPSPRFYHLLSFPNYDSAKVGRYPDPVIDPLYLGKLNEQQAFYKYRADVIKELLKNNFQLMSYYKKAGQNNMALDAYIDKEARSRMEEQIKSKVIRIRKK